MSDIEQRLREAMDGVTPLNDLALKVGLFVDNAGTASQNKTLVDDAETREAIELNIVAPLIVEVSIRDQHIASLRSKLEEAEGALPPVKPLDLAAVIRDSFLAGAGMDTSKRETQRIPEDVYERLNKYDPEHVPAFKRLEALLSAAYRARRTLATKPAVKDDETVVEALAGLCDWIENEVGAELPFDARAALSGSGSGWRGIETAPNDQEVLIAYWRWRNSVSPGTIVVQSAMRTEFHGPGIWSWVVSDNKHGPFPIRGWCDGDIVGWMPLPAAPQQGGE